MTPVTVIIISFTVSTPPTAVPSIFNLLPTLYPAPPEIILTVKDPPVTTTVNRAPCPTINVVPDTLL